MRLFGCSIRKIFAATVASFAHIMAKAQKTSFRSPFYPTDAPNDAFAGNSGIKTYQMIQVTVNVVTITRSPIVARKTMLEAQLF